ncbi:MAG: hydroxyisourate hydrolase [Chitinophagales bacterium]
MSSISTHILDTSKGSPAQDVHVILYQQQDNEWIEIASGKTNSDGRIPDLLSKETIINLGIYKLKFDTQQYFDAAYLETFYPYIEIIFEIKKDAHYHVPLLLNPFGYSTYRGS